MMKKSNFFLIPFIFVFLLPLLLENLLFCQGNLLFGEEGDSYLQKEGKNQSESLVALTTDQESSSDISSFFSSVKKKQKYGRSVAPDMGVEIYSQFFEAVTKGKFGPDEEFPNLQDNFHLSTYGTLVGGSLDLFFVGGKISFSLEEARIKGSSNGPPRNFILDGQLFEPSVPTKVRYQYFSLASTLYFDMIPPEIQGFQLSLFLHGQFIQNTLKISNSKGRFAQNKFQTLIPSFGFVMVLEIIQNTPKSPQEVFHPSSFLSFLFRVEGSAFLNYASRRILHFYLFEGGIRISTSTFWDLDFTYRSTSFEVKRTDEKQVIEAYREGIYFAFRLKF